MMTVLGQQWRAHRCCGTSVPVSLYYAAKLFIWLAYRALLRKFN
jgi:hypothetical protein